MHTYNVVYNHNSMFFHGKSAQNR